MSVISANSFNSLVSEMIETCYGDCWVGSTLVDLRNKYGIKFNDKDSSTGYLSVVTNKARLEFILNNTKNHEFTFIISSHTEVRKSVNLTWMGNSINPKTSKSQHDRLKQEVGLILRQFMILSGIKFIPS